MATASKPLAKHVVCAADELPADTSRVVEVRGRSIALINDAGRLHALRNVCPHHGAPLCSGRVAGFMRPSEPHTYDYSGDDPADRVVLCPWHGYKFRLSDGRCVTDPDRMAVRTYPVEVEDGQVVVWM